MDFFPFALDYMLANEGGFSDRKTDLGGPTNMGITLATLSKWRGHKCTIDDVKELTTDEAKVIYRCWYWSDLGLGLVQNRAVAAALFDQAVLNGPKIAIMMAQLACNDCGSKLVVDGVVGPLTAAQLGQVDLVKFLAAYRTELKGHFDAIVARNPAQMANYRGWLNRAARLLTLAFPKQESEHAQA